MTRPWTDHITMLAVAAGTLLLCLATNSASSADDEKPEDKTVALLKAFAEEFVDITPGQGRFPATFQMGSADGPSEERPPHEVTFNYTFSIAKYEVPQNLYEAVMGANPSRWKGPRNSVEKMSWTDANEFCREITALLREKHLIKDAEAIRLPTEAEWEYCCRAGSKTRFSFGDVAQSDEEVGQFDAVMVSFGPSKIQGIKAVREVTGLGLKDAKDLVESLPKPLKTGLSKEDAEKIKKTIAEVGGACVVREQMTINQYAWHTGNAAGNDPPVGALKPNRWGLYDMHGYLWEFTADAWSDDYSHAPRDGSAVKSAAEPDAIVLRSGSWKDPADKLTSTARRKAKASETDDAIGFRCVKALAK